jgi:anti-sigma regulatory factor (Ser/Thr protein kinase)
VGILTTQEVETRIEIVVSHRVAHQPHTAVPAPALLDVLDAVVDRPDQIGGFRRRLRTLLNERGVRDAEREAIVLASAEALNNALQVCTVADCHVEVSVALVADYVCVEVRDASRGFRGACVDRIQDVDEDAEHGRGLYLMRELVESLEIVPRDRGTLVRLVKKLDAAEGTQK